MGNLMWQSKWISDSYYCPTGNEIFLEYYGPITSLIEITSLRKYEFIKESVWVQKSSVKNLRTDCQFNSIRERSGNKKYHKIYLIWLRV